MIAFNHTRNEYILLRMFFFLFKSHSSCLVMKIELTVLFGSALAAIPQSMDFRYPLAYNEIPRNFNFRVPLEVTSEGRLFARVNFTNIP